MPFNNLPLLSVASVQAAIEQIAKPSAPTTVVSPQTEPPLALQAEVTRVQLDKLMAVLTLSIKGEEFNVRSQLPLPAGTKLDLLLKPSSTENPQTQTKNTPELSVKQITLPNPTARMQPAPELLQRFIQARHAILTELNTSTSNPTTPAADTYTKPSVNSLLNNPTALLNTLKVPMESAGINNIAPSALNALLNLSQAPTSQVEFPAAVKQLLQQWQQNLPELSQLNQAAGLKQALSNHSGVQFERQLLAILTQLANPNSNPANMFKALWQKAAALSAKTDTLASSLTAASPSPMDAKGKLEQILHSVQQKLEANSTQASATTPEPAPSLLSSLLGTNHKAVLSRALILWANTLAGQSSGAEAKPAHIPSPLANAPEGLQLLQKALAHIELEQVRLAQPQEQLQLNIPLLFKEGGQSQQVQLEISQEEQAAEKNKSGKKQTLWRLRLFFELEQLGQLDADIELSLPKIKVCFWSKQQSTLNALHLALTPLQQKLTSLGAEVEEVQVRYGELPKASRNQIQARLIDTKC